MPTPVPVAYPNGPATALPVPTPRALAFPPREAAFPTPIPVPVAYPPNPATALPVPTPAAFALPPTL